MQNRADDDRLGGISVARSHPPGPADRGDYPDEPESGGRGPRTSPGDDLWVGQPGFSPGGDRDINDPYFTLWTISPERAGFLKRRRVNVALVSVVLLVVFGELLASRRVDARLSGLFRDLAWMVVILAGLALIWSLIFPYFSAKLSLQERRKHQTQYRAELALQDLSLTSDGNIPLERLYVMNRRQLDAYQDITKRQQRSAYRMAQISSAVGLVILAVGATVAIRTTGTDAFLATGLTALGTTLSAFLGRTFLANHRAANEQLNKYADEPHITGRMLSAERVARLPAWPSASEQTRLLLTAMLAAPNGSTTSRPDGDADTEDGEDESDDETQDSSIAPR